MVATITEDTFLYPLKMLHVDKVDSLQAEKVHITASGLKSWTCYKLRMTCQHEFGIHASYGIFKSDSLGTIDLERDEPVRGTYHGVDPMGLFVSMNPTTDYPYGEMIKCNQGAPYYYRLQLITDSNEILDHLNLKKHWTHPLITRINVAQNGFYGTLFKPPGPGPFPSIIDVPGANGRLVERTAAALASEGFLVLTFVYYLQFDDLPQTIPEVDVECCQKPVDYLLSLPYSNGKIGLYGLSFGGLLANFMATKFPQVSAVVTVNVFESWCRDELVMKENGSLIPCDIIDEGVSFWKGGVLGMAPSYRNFYENMKEEHKLPWNRAPKTTVFRVIACMDDWVMDSLQCARNIQKDLKGSGHHVEVEVVPGGHLLNPPNFPHHGYIYNKFQDLIWGLGGDCLMHGRSQETVWRKNIDFYKRHLGCPPEIPEWSRLQEVVVPKMQLFSRL